jgi:cytochrome c oxidase accessory protein FixG
MCPWPRIQSAMLDERSLIVTYKDWRGEPRTHGLKRSEAAGDCIDCMACVQVCPTGIDIRDGAQLACITCALCIDACDATMAKVGRPRGLIDYATLEDCRAEAAGAPPVPIRRTLTRPRTFVYFGLWGGIGLAMMFAFGARNRLDLEVAHDRNPLWVRLSDGSLRNAYTVRLRNMESRPRQVRLEMSGLGGARMWDSMSDESQAARSLSLSLAPDQVTERRLYVRGQAQGLADDRFQLRLTAADGDRDSDMQTLRFDRPEDDR